MKSSSEQYDAPTRSWRNKFRDAFRGIRIAIADSSSFYVHITFTILVVLLAILLRLDRTEWCLLTLCVAIVMAAETFNASLEHLARAIDTGHNPIIGKSLDSASGAVLIVSIGAAIVGVIVFLPRFVELFT